jgi:cobalt/nickel transport system permease protein
MSDALVSPVVAGAFWAVSATALAVSVVGLRKDPDEKKIPLMAVLGAFVFAAQLINFSIPGTGSSGHLGGGLLLAVLLGPSAAFIVMTSILVLQAFLFADGGLLSLGCNVFNLGFLTAFLAYPLIYRPIVGKSASGGRLLAGSLAAAIVSLQLGALMVTLQTVLSGVTKLPFGVFLGFMQGIHLVIGVVEGLVTFAVLRFLYSVRPELQGSAVRSTPLKHLLVGVLIAAFIVAGGIAWIASEKPDGLEWSVLKSSGQAENEVASSSLHRLAGEIQKKAAVFRDYSLPRFHAKGTDHPPGPSAGLLGTGLTLGVIFLAGVLARLFRKRKSIRKTRKSG